MSTDHKAERLFFSSLQSSSCSHTTVSHLLLDVLGIGRQHFVRELTSHASLCFILQSVCELLLRVRAPRILDVVAVQVPVEEEEATRVEQLTARVRKPITTSS